VGGLGEIPAASVGMTVGVRERLRGSGGMIGEGRERWRWLRTLTPHLTSPLEGGRDALGKGDELKMEERIEEGVGDGAGDEVREVERARCANGL